MRARFAHQRARALFSAAGIALGVALGFGVHLINGAALDEFSLAVRSMAGEADLEVRGARAGFDEALYPVLAGLPGIAVASPVLELDAGLARQAGAARSGSSPGSLKLLGIDALRAAQVQPALFADDPQRMFDLLRPDTVLLSPAAAASLELSRGAKLALLAGAGEVELEVAGIVPGLRGQAALTDIATAQWRFGRVGLINRIDLRFVPGANSASVRERIEALLPAGAHVAQVEQLEAQGANLSRSYRVNLNVLALVALFTGGFLVFSAQALEVTRRRAEHGLLRVLGLTRGGLVRRVLGEAAVIGAAGSAAGLALGYGLARVAVLAAGGDLGAGMFRGITPQVGFDPWAACAFFAAGLGIALAAAWLPALDAARAAPARALKSGDEQQMFERLLPVWPGLALLAAGAGFAQLGPVGGIPVFGYGAIALILVGGILLMPRALAAFLAVAGMPRAVPLGLAFAQLRGAPGQAMVSLAAIVASFALMVAMAIMVASFRESVDDWLNAVLPADFYLRTSHLGETTFLAPQFAAGLRALPEVERVEFLRNARLTLDPARPVVALVARDLPGGIGKTVPLIGPARMRAPSDPPSAWVSEAVATVYGYAPGARITLALGGAQVPFIVDGVWRDYARQHGAIVIDRADYARLTGDDRVNDAALWLRAGVSEARIEAAVRNLPGGGMPDMAGPGEIRRISLQVFDRSFAVTYALEAVAVLVGLFGLSSSLGAIVLARKREFGMLRHLGMTRAQIGAMLAFEGGLLAAFGAAAGLAVGGVIGFILIRVVNRQSFNWGMEVHPPYALLAALTLVMIALAALTAFWSGREAMGMGPVRAVKEDW
ncbi:MAG: FtsX-like permease family protein [Betaproteobacteria bacterium]